MDPPSGSSVADTIEGLRKWKRWCLRMSELGGTLPDSSLQVRALGEIIKSVLASHPDIAFSVNLTRHNLQIDSNPDETKVGKLHAQLLGELEAINHRVFKERDSDKDKSRDAVSQGSAAKVRGVDAQDGTSAPSPKAPKPPKVNPKGAGVAKAGAQSEGQPSGKPQCSFYLSSAGCKKGADCTFAHNWDSIPVQDRSQRCRNCGGKGHKPSECKAGLKGDDKPKPKPPLKPSGTPKSAPDVPPPPAAPSSSNQQIKSMLADAALILQQAIPAPDPAGTVPIPPQVSPVPPQVHSSSSNAQVSSGAGFSTAPPTQGTPVTLASLSAQLEGIRAMARDYEVKAFSVAQDLIERNKNECRALLDSGVTHVVIPYSTELTNLEPVPVTLAGDARTQWLRTSGGTLLVPEHEGTGSSGDKPQTILPLGALVECLGCNITWSRKNGLRVVHPAHGVLRTGVAKNKCPYIQESQALDLIRELEDTRLRRFEEELQELECHMHALDKPLNPTEAVQRYIDSGDRGDALRAIFCQPYLRDLPEELKVQLAEQLPGMTEAAGKQILKRLPLKRAKRRALLASSHWVVHLCSGSEVSDDPLKAWTQEQGFELLQVDVLSKGGKGWNLLKNNGVWSVLLWAAASGRISTILASPPKSSFEANSPLAVQDMFLWTVASVAKGRGVPYFRCSNLPVGDEGLRQAWTAWSRMAEIPQTPKSEGFIHIVPMSVITNLPLQHLATESFEFMGNGRQSHSRACGRWTMRLRSSNSCLSSEPCLAWGWCEEVLFFMVQKTAAS